MEIFKLSDTEIKLVVTKVEEVILTKDQLLQELEGVKASKVNFTNQIALLDTRIAEINNLIKEADKLGIITNTEKANKDK